MGLRRRAAAMAPTNLAATLVCSRFRRACVPLCVMWSTLIAREAERTLSKQREGRKHTGRTEKRRKKMVG